MTMLASTGAEHIAHGEHHAEPHQEGDGEEDDLGVGEIAPEPVGEDLHRPGHPSIDGSRASR